MGLQQKINTNLRKYSLHAIFGISLISIIGTKVSDSIKHYNLENSNYILVERGSPLSLYGFDDDKNGQVDRIEEVGVIPFKTGLPAFRIEKTHLPTDSDYSHYSKRLKALGKPRETD